MAAGAVGAAGLAVWIGRTQGAPDLAAPVFGGMIGPLVAVAATWVVVAREFERRPAGVMRVMLRAFLAKALFFVAYVVAMVKVAGLDPVVFGASFTAFFVALYAAQTALFARLFRRGLDGGR